MSAKAHPWRWIDARLIHAVHDEQLAEHGGGSGLRDANMLESALARPQQLAHYGNPDVADLAAAYGYGLARNHPFVDGNKRIAAALFLYFLERNGLLYRAGGNRIIGNDGLATLTLLIAVSKPEEMDTMIKIIVTILNRGQP